MQKISITGVPLNTPNMGVTALSISLIKLFRCIDNGIDIGILTSAKIPEIRHVEIDDQIIQIKLTNYRKSFRSKLSQHIIVIFILAIIYRLFPSKGLRRIITKNCPIIDEIISSRFIGSMHGGDSFSDIYGITRFFGLVAINFVIIILNKPLILLPQTYGPYKNKFVKKTAKVIIDCASNVYTRDKDGKNKVCQMFPDLANTEKIHFCPDVAFCLPYPQYQPSETRNNALSKKTIIGININGLMFNGGYSRNNMFNLKIDYPKILVEIITFFANITNTYIILVPHNIAAVGNIESDLEACKKVLNNVSISLRDNIVIREFGTTPSQIKSSISQCDFFIGSRMHACIGGLSSMVPTVGIAYSKKFIGVFDSLGLPNSVIDACSMDDTTALSIIRSQYKCRKETKEHLFQSIPNIKSQILETFKSMYFEQLK